MHFLETVGGFAVKNPRTVKRSPTHAVDNAGITFFHQVITVNVVLIQKFGVDGFCNGIGRGLGSLKHPFIEPLAYFFADFDCIADTRPQNFIFKFGFDVIENDGRHQNQPDGNGGNDKQQNFVFDGSVVHAIASLCSYDFWQYIMPDRDCQGLKNQEIKEKFRVYFLPRNKGFA